MSSKPTYKLFTVLWNDACKANEIIQPKKMETKEPDIIINRIVKYVPVVINNDNSRTSIELRLIQDSSDLLFDEVCKNQILHIPRLLFNIITFETTKVIGEMAIDTLEIIRSNQLKTQVLIDYESLKVSDLIYYARKYSCINIRNQTLEKLRTIICIFIMQLMTPIAVELPKNSYTPANNGHETRRGLVCGFETYELPDKKCRTRECNSDIFSNSRECFSAHKEHCPLFIRGYVITTFISCVMEYINYFDIWQIYFKRVTNDKTGRYITTEVHSLSTRLIVPSDAEDYSSNRSMRFILN
jgi:hypothetical protein